MSKNDRNVNIGIAVAIVTLVAGLVFFAAIDTTIGLFLFIMNLLWSSFFGWCVWGILDESEKRKQGTKRTALTRKSLNRSIGATGPGFEALISIDGVSGVAVDEKTQQVAIMLAGANNSIVLPYRDVLASEIIEDGETVTRTMRGSQIGGALIGGLALGGVGAIIGGLSGKTKAKTEISSVVFRITINDVKTPIYDVLLFSKGLPEFRAHYPQAIKAAQEWHAKIKAVIHQADQEDRRQERKNAEKTVAVVPHESLEDKLTQLGNLRDKGLLTEAEFESQKAKLLDSY